MRSASVIVESIKRCKAGPDKRCRHCEHNAQSARLDVVSELRRMADDPHMGATTRALLDAADQLEAVVRGADAIDTEET